jgi:hypothetical protein
VIRVLRRGRRWLRRRRLLLFDLASLRAELEAAGFVNVERLPIGESSDQELRGIDSRTEPIEDVLLLTVEAERP